MSGHVDYTPTFPASVQCSFAIFDLHVTPTLLERGLEQSGIDVFRWNLFKSLIFEELARVYADRYIRRLAEHLPEDIGRLIVARMFFR
jgi:hypothetical protein